jgi:hypothetical protein
VLDVTNNRDLHRGSVAAGGVPEHPATVAAACGTLPA